MPALYLFAISSFSISSAALCSLGPGSRHSAAKTRVNALMASPGIRDSFPGPARSARAGTQGDTLCASSLRTAGLRREPLIALAAVEQMPAHRGASLRDCAAANGVYNRAMFALEHLAVDAPG